jgi:anti-sigma B factor antagonist
MGALDGVGFAVCRSRRAYQRAESRETLPRVFFDRVRQGCARGFLLNASLRRSDGYATAVPGGLRQPSGRHRPGRHRVGRRRRAHNRPSCRRRALGARTHATVRSETAPRTPGAGAPRRLSAMPRAMRSSRRAVTHMQRNGRRVTIRLAGEHDVSTAPEMTQRIDEALRSGADRVCVNLDAVTFLDASVLGALVRGRSRCAAHDARFVVTCSNQRTRRVFAIAKLAALLHDHS